jgi:hypothetical protein
VFTIQYAKNLPQGDYTRYNQIGIETRSEKIGIKIREIRSDRNGDNQKWDEIRTEARGGPTEAFVWRSYSEH